MDKKLDFMTDLQENFSTESLILAIQCLANPKEEDKFKEAELFLKKVEKSKKIWLKSQEILMLPNMEKTVKHEFFQK